jgi:hypothetical protein
VKKVKKLPIGRHEKGWLIFMEEKKIKIAKLIMNQNKPRAQCSQVLS